jgi:hypothetical protein
MSIYFYANITIDREFVCRRDSAQIPDSGFPMTISILLMFERVVFYKINKFTFLNYTCRFYY